MKTSTTILLTLIAAWLLAWASAAEAVVVETFATDVDPFPGTAYGDWSLSTSATGAARVVTAGDDGVLEMRRTGDSVTAFGWATQTSSELFGTATFLEKFPDGFAVAADLGAKAANNNSYRFVGISIGNRAAIFYPGYYGATNFQWRNMIAGSNYDATGIGWSGAPSVSTTTTLQHMRVYVEPIDADYRLTVTLTEGIRSFSIAKTFTAAELGVLDNVGLYFRSATTDFSGDGLFDNFAVTIPEPGSVLLWAVGAAMVLVARAMQLPGGGCKFGPICWIFRHTSDCRRGCDYIEG